MDPRPADLAAVLAELQALREDMQHALRRMLAIQDRRDLAVFLPAAYTVLGHRTWTAAECVKAAMASTDPAGRALMADVFADYTSEPGGLRSFGKFLSRCDGAVCGGLRLVRVGDDDAGGLYAIGVSRTSKPCAPVAPASTSAEDEAID